MRLKLGGNLRVGARVAAAALGHDVETVVDEALGGAPDGAVLAAAGREDRFLLTLDRGFGDARHYPPGTHPGIAVIRVEASDAATVTRAVQALLTNHDLGGSLLRVRRPV